MLRVVSPGMRAARGLYFRAAALDGARRELLEARERVAEIERNIGEELPMLADEGLDLAGLVLKLGPYGLLRLAIPMLPIIIVVLAFNFLGDGLRDSLDPYNS